MGFLRPDDVEQLTEIFGQLERVVTIRLWSDDLDLRLFVDEIAETAQGKVIVEKVGDERAAELGIDKSPGMALAADGVKGRLYFYGHPVGYEMATLLAAIIDIGTGDGGELDPATVAELASLPRDVHIQVFSTPS